MRLIRGNARELKIMVRCLVFLLILTLFYVPIAGSEDSFTQPVSVTFPYTIQGNFSSQPVSVSYFGTPLLNGVLTSGAVSVSWPSGLFADMHAPGVSVVFNRYLGLWHFDGNWQDSSGNNLHGTAYGGAEIVPDGKSNSAASFDGSGAYSDFGSSAVLRPAHAVSIEAWIRINPDSSGSMYIAGNADQTTMTGYGIVIQNSGLLEFRIGNGTWRSVTSSTALTLGLWHHIAGTFDGGKLRLYINGVLDNETAAEAVITYSAPFRAGYAAGTSGEGYYAGLIDELAVYNRPLSDDEIASRYRDGKIDITPPEPPTVNPVASPTASTVITLSGTKEADSAIWVNNTRIVALNSSASWQGSYSLSYGINTLNIKAVDAADNQSNPVTVTVILDNQPPVIETSIPANNSDTAKIIENVSITLLDDFSPVDLSASMAGAIVKNAAGEVVQGVWSMSPSGILFTSSAPFPQDTYTVTISPADVLGNTGTAQIVFRNYDATPPVTTISLSGTLGADGWYSTPVLVTLSADDGPEGSGADKTEYSLDGTNWSDYGSPVLIDADGICTLSYRSTDAAGNIETAQSTQIRINTTGLMGWWRMDNDWMDSSVYGRNGTAHNGADFSSNTRIGSHSGSFDGVNDYMIAPVNGSALQSLSVEMWVMRKADDSKGIFQWANTLSAANPFIYFHDLNGTLRIYLNGDYGLSTNIEMNNWHHLALTNDGSVWKLYKDGALIDSYTGGKTYQQNAASIYLGNGYHGYWNGLIDEVTIYNRTLSEEEILENYLMVSIEPPTVNPVDSLTPEQTVFLIGTKQAGTSILVNGAEIYPLDDLTEWGGTYILRSGENHLNITAKDANGYQSSALILSVILDDAAPVVVNSVPANNSFVNTPLSELMISLSDEYSEIDLEATLDGATVKNDSGQDISGIWMVSGNNVLIFTPSTSFGEGVYTIIIHPTDAFGNWAEAQISFSYDATAPPSPVINPVTSPTKNLSQVITGAKSADTAAVVLYASQGIMIGTVAYPSSTSWSVTVSNLQPGQNTVAAYALDAAGNQSEEVQVVIIYDSAPPSIPVVDPLASPTRETSVPLTGTKEAGSYLYINHLKTAALYSDSSWSHTVNLTEGANTFTVYAKDEAGNQSDSVSASITRDTTAPVISSSAPLNNSYVGETGSIEILLSDAWSAVDPGASLIGASVNHSTGAAVSGVWTVQGSYLVFTPSSAFADGIHTVVLHPADSLGNTGTASFSFTVDTAPPVVQSLVMNPASPHKAEAVTFTLTFNKNMLTTVQPVVTFGQTSPFDNYPLAGGSWTSSKVWKATYTFSPSTGDGPYTIRISDAKDSLGNSITPAEIGSFILDTTPPEPAGLNPATTPTKTPNQALTGTKPADTAIIINNIQRVSANPSTDWSYTYPLSEGQNNLSIIARDAAGNDSTPVTISIVLDTTPPAFTVVFQSPAASAVQTLTGTKEPGCVVKLNNNQIFGPEDMSSSWAHEVTLIQGITNRFVFTASDAIGNTTAKTIDILYDTSAPSQLGPGVLVADGSGKGTEVTLSWTAYIEAPDIAYYRVYMSAADFTDTTGMSPIGTTNKGTKTFKVQNLFQGSTYYFGVVPVDISSNLDPAVNTASAVPVDTVPPEEVRITSVSAGYAAATGNSITIQWTGSINSSGDLADQVVYFDSGQGYDAGTSLGRGGETTPVLSYTKTGLNDAAKYKFKITVKDTGGRESSGAVAEGVTRLSNPAISSADPGNGKVTLNWNKVSGQVANTGGQDSSLYVKQYNIYRTISDSQQNDVGTMTLIKSVSASTSISSYSYTDTGLTNEMTYQYAVTSLNTYGAEKPDVQSTGVKPRMDETGPVISGFNLTNNQVITAPLTVTASATDAESSVDRMELYIGDTLVKTQTGGSISHFWNVVGAEDGNHTVKLMAYDQHGNVTEESRQVIVSLAAPAIPAISGHTVVQTEPVYTVNISGTTQISTTVILKVNDVVVSQTSTSDPIFSFDSIVLAEGDNLLAVKASHRGGESAYSQNYKITVDTGAPPEPQGLAAQVLAGGILRFTWKSGTGEIPSGYNLYMSNSGSDLLSGEMRTKTNSSPIMYLLREYTPPDDDLKYYAVTALDSAGNESGISNIVSASSDRSAPLPVSIEYRYYDENGNETYPASLVGRGKVKITLQVSELLKETPFFSLEPAEGSPIVIAMDKIEDTHYQGEFDVTESSPHGPTTYKFSGKDMNGNRGNAQGAGITLDVKGPVASVQFPVTALQISRGEVPSPVRVDIVFDEPSVTVPELQVEDSVGYVSPVNDFETADNGIHWSGSLDLSGLEEGQAEFILVSAKDELGNTGTKVSSGRTILLYRDNVPPPDVPEGLAAKSEKGGVITLTWYPVSGALAYDLYRRSENGQAPEKIKMGISGSLTQDTPPADGKYFYSVSSIGFLEIESMRSIEAEAISDRTGPEAPRNLSLSLDGNGVTAVWEGVSDQQGTVRYHLYRSGSIITAVSGLTPVAKVPITRAVDTGPAQSKRFYAVVAVDHLGNEGHVSETKEIVFPVSPVRDLVIDKTDFSAPVITWHAPADGSIAGYHIYRNGSRVTQYPVSAFSYADGYYSGGIVTYGISAVSTLGIESPVKEAVLSELSMKLEEGTVLRRGLLETAKILVSNQQSVAGSEMTIDTISVKIGLATASSIQGPFTLEPNTTLQIEKVLSTTANAPTTVAALITAQWAPSPGVTVKITQTSSAEVTGSGSAFEIFNEPLVRGTDAKIRLKVHNLGSSHLEFLTSENSGQTKKVSVYLKDEDGNLLSTGYLNQRLGNAIIDTGKYATARLNSGEELTTDPVVLNVPVSAPYKVILEASIENTYYHYNKPDQVTAPGMRQFAETTISETAYRAYAEPEHAFYPDAQSVLISGQATSNTPSPLAGEGGGEGLPMPNVPVKIGVSVKGFDRYYTATTDEAGNFVFTFTPGPNEAGIYSVWAVHPDINDRTVQSTFVIAGLSVNPSSATVRMARGRSLDIPVTLMNYGGGTLSGLTFNIVTSPGITAEIQQSTVSGQQSATTIAAGQSIRMILRITTSASAPDTGFASVTATTNEGLSVKIEASISIVSLISIINTIPSFIDTGMVRGSQKISSFTIKNTGEETLRNARIEGPSTSWMSLTVNRELGDIQPGENKSVGIMFSPTETIPQGVYDDRIVVYSDNHIPYTFHIQVTVTSDAVGNVLFDVLNELMEDVSGATITFQHQTLYELLYTLKTGPDGTAMKFDIPEGRYTFNISPPAGHTPYSGTFMIIPGITTAVPIALEMKMVTVTWSVEEITIEDRYEIKINQTYETNVPTPVLVTEPPSIKLPKLQPGQVFNGEFTVSNFGLVSAEYKGIQFPVSVGDLDIEVLVTIPSHLNAMQKVTVPYRVTRRLQATIINLPSAFSNQYACISSPSLVTDDPSLSFIDTPFITQYASQREADSSFEEAVLFDEIQGYGGGVTSQCRGIIPVTTTFESVICPNTDNRRVVTKTTSYIIIYDNCDDDTSTMPPDGSGNYQNAVTYDQYLQEQLSGGKGVPNDFLPLTLFGDECNSVGGGNGGDGDSDGGGGSGGGSGGNGGGSGGGEAQDPRCTSGEPIVVGASGFTSGITVPVYGSNQVAISSPGNSQEINKFRTIVTGAIDPQLSGEQIIVETSSPGMTDPDSKFLAHISGNYYAALAPLQTGTNNIKVIAKDLQGVQKDATVTVNVTPAPETLILTYTTPNEGFPGLKDNGLETLDVTLTTLTAINNPISKYSWDFNGDRAADLECGNLPSVTASFKESGIYLPSVTITDSQGNTYTDTTIVNVLDEEDMDSIFKLIWSKMKFSLAKKDTEGALNYFVDSSKDEYREIFHLLSEQLPDLISSMREIHASEVNETVAEYYILRTEDGLDISYFIYFFKDANGKWRIDRF
jgi:hypothetical protein